MSFGFGGYFRQGSWRDFRAFILSQRRDVLARITTISAELHRIGLVRVLYARRDPNNPTSPMSERRIGLDVSPNTSLEKLCQALIAQGGNIFDASLFLRPDSIQIVDAPDASPGNPESGEASPTRVVETQPYGGIASSQTADPSAGGTYTGGWINLIRYPPRRFGNTTSYAAEAAEMSRTINASRAWVSKEIKTLRNDLEARILKLCDLSEQLKLEMEEVLPQAVGGSVPGLIWVPDQHALSHNVATIVSMIDEVFYPRLSNGDFDMSRPRVTGPNPSFPVLLDDAPNGEEDWTSLG